MRSTFTGLTIGASGLEAYMAALNTTSNNLANAHTDGYSRQQVTRVEAESLRTYNKTGTVGMGVWATTVTQVRDTYYDYKYWENNHRYGNFYAKNYYAGEIEDYFEEENQKGVTKSLSDLFNTLKSLADDASSLPTRNEAVNGFLTVSETVSELYDNLQSVQSSVNE